jgi:HAD superfamily hydrolase (TIGR01450 family)
MTDCVITPTLERQFAGYAFDLDGTVYLGDELLDGAAETITVLRDVARVVFVTNKPLETAESYAAKLTKLGIVTSRDDVVTPLDSLVQYLGDNHRGANVLTVAETLVDDVLRANGHAVVDNPLEADVVVVSFDRTFTYAKLLAAYQAVGNGASIIATNPDPFCPTPEGGLPDCAAMLAAVEACTSTRAEAIVGKPSAHMGRAILTRLGAAPEESVIVGDRLLTDIAMADELGMSSVLVLTGVTKLDDLTDSSVRPDFIVHSVRNVLPNRLERP